jgi:ankyrin repeat protein
VGYRYVVQHLIDRGTDVNLKGDGHNTPLNWAAYGGHVGMSTSFGCYLSTMRNVQTQDHNGRTPLHDAIWGDDLRGDYPRVVRLLLEHGANTNALTGTRQQG